MVMYSGIYEFRARVKNHDKSRQTNVKFRGFLEFRIRVFFVYKKLSYRRGTARRATSVEML